MKTLLSQYPHWFRRGLVIGLIASCGLLTQCAKEETATKEEPAAAPSLVDQYKAQSKSSAENPGVAGSPGQMEEEKKEEAH